jgi:hypothetical protein
MKNDDIQSVLTCSVARLWQKLKTENSPLTIQPYITRRYPPMVVVI